MAHVVPRFLDPARGSTPSARIMSAEVDLDKHETQIEDLESVFHDLRDDVKWVKRLLVGVLASTTGAALMLVAQGFTR